MTFGKPLDEFHFLVPLLGGVFQRLWTGRKNVAASIEAATVVPNVKTCSSCVSSYLLSLAASAHKRKRRQAKRERQRLIVEAQGEAGAIELRAGALARNPQLVQYEYVQNLPAGVRTVIADANTIINFSDLFTRPAAQ